MKPILLFFLTLVLIVGCKSKTEEFQSVSYAVVLTAFGDTKAFDSKGAPIGNLVKYKLNDGDTIKTGERAQAEILLATGGVIRILEKSEVIMDSKFFPQGKNSRIRLKLNMGQVFVSQSIPLKNEESLQVQTPTQIGGVRGTEFLVQADSEKSKILVGEGKVQTEWVPTNGEVPEFSESSAMVSSGNKSIADVSKRETLGLDEDEKALLKSQSTSAAEIREQAQAQIQSIMDQFNEDKERIKIDVEAFKAENQEKLNEQKETNQQELNQQKEKNRELMSETKGDKDKSTKSMQNANDSEKSEIQNKAKSEFDAIKQGLKN